MIQLSRIEWETISGREFDGPVFINEKRCIAIRTNLELLIVEFFPEDGPSSWAFKLKLKEGETHSMAEGRFCYFLQQYL